MGSAILFWVLALFTLAFGFGVVRARNLFKGAISLALSLFGVAGIFVMLNAEFLAGIQVLLYIGAVVTLVIFAIMLTQGMSDPRIRQFTRMQIPGALLIVLLVILLVNGGLLAAPAILEAEASAGATVASASVQALGTDLLYHYILPFDVITVLLLVAMVGAIVLARKE
jgi:NADH-quinone oxidoreductase subunit J